MSGKGKAKIKLLRTKRATKQTQTKEKMLASQCSSHVNLRVALSQMNSVVGDFKYNAGRIKSCLEEATRLGADLILFPELALT